MMAPLVFQDMVVLIPTQGTYPTQHNSPNLGTQGRIGNLCVVSSFPYPYIEASTHPTVVYLIFS